MLRSEVRELGVGGPATGGWQAPGYLALPKELVSGEEAAIENIH